ncbi:GNAT family N-acetyltransferase [Cohaesibacter sp. ES.047]|uniref:GNAT family N-acetyltransferase n=1 Tax=Cohaesibacter sp. ES.047 TaxID=1798205 RepID=UPI0015609716|nr:GNAT family N-acetyltransferase [Cohaesibacter sp. ES.047]
MQRHIRKLSSVEERTLIMRCSQSGRLLGLVPLTARRKMRATILEYANLGLVDYALPTLHPDIWNWVPDPVTLGVKLSETLGAYDMLRIKHMPADNPEIMRLFPNAYMERASFSAHAVELGPDYDEWRQTAISKAERKSRDKKRRAMLRNGEWQMRVLTDPIEIRTAFEYLRVYHKDRYADRPGFDMLQDPASFDFYVDLAINEAESGFARTYQFTYDDRVAAVQFGIADRGRYVYLMMGLDYQRMSKYSPGLLMTEDIARDCIDRGMTLFDLAVGDEPYKAKFGTKSTPIYTLWHAHSMLGSVGMGVADMVRGSQFSGRIRRWVS